MLLLTMSIPAMQDFTIHKINIFAIVFLGLDNYYITNITYINNTLCK